MALKINADTLVTRGEVNVDQIKRRIFKFYVDSKKVMEISPPSLPSTKNLKKSFFSNELFSFINILAKVVLFFTLQKNAMIS